MSKDQTIGIRVTAELKKALLQIATKEGRSLAQLCEIFLRGAVASYRDEGHPYLQRLVTRQKKDASAE